MSVMETKSRESIHKDYLYQAQYFGFSARQFFNYVYNILLDNWKKTVEDIILPLIIKPGDAKRKSEFEKKALDRLFQNGFLDITFKSAQEFAVKYVFDIPEMVILPGDESNLNIEQYDEEDLLKEIDLLNEEIVELKKKLKIKKANEHNEIVLANFFEGIERELT